MSRYTGPKLRLKRSVGIDLPGLGVKTLERRPYPPGQHGQARKPKKSIYGNQLLEKQKLKFNYGVREKQLRRYMKAATRKKGAPGENLLGLLECRLDNVIFRAGLAPSIPAARQIVNHGHIKINGRKVNIPSYQVSAGETFEVSDKAQKIPFVQVYWENPALAIPEWIERDEAKFQFKTTKAPDHESVPFPVEISTVVEYYSKMS